MASFKHKFLFSATIACAALTLGMHPAFAKTHHHKHHVKAHHVSSSKTIVRIAQEHLKNLGYYTGNVDGIMGPQTKTAIKKFQHDQSLIVDGVLGPKTNRALEEADHRIIGSHSFVAHDIVTSVDPTTVNPAYTNGLNGNNQSVSTRFARVDVTESGKGPDKRYNINLNGTPILTADGQPSVIGISPTYDLGNEDAIVFTTFSPNDTGCVYKNHVLALTNGGNQMLDIENCTRNYQARIENGSLYVTFPENDDNRAFGATWRVEGMTVERL
jgi:hypothetical protein